MCVCTLHSCTDFRTKNSPPSFFFSIAFDISKPDNIRINQRFCGVKLRLLDFLAGTTLAGRPGEFTPSQNVYV